MKNVLETAAELAAYCQGHIVALRNTNLPDDLRQKMERVAICYAAEELLGWVRVNRPELSSLEREALAAPYNRKVDLGAVGVAALMVNLFPEDNFLRALPPGVALPCPSPPCLRGNTTRTRRCAVFLIEHLVESRKAR